MLTGNSSLGCHCSKISRIEVGQRGIRAGELRILLQEYGASEDERAAVSAISDPYAMHGWWEHFADVLPEAYSDYLILEAAASRILVYESHRVPGLLQTEPYACAIAAADPVVPAGLRERATRAALVRQKAIVAQRRPELAVVIGEGALHQQGARRSCASSSAILPRSAGTTPRSPSRSCRSRPERTPGSALAR
jgi:hypothetical protein